ncbi:hypothetical protein ISS07_05935 [Candidatus Woesearchaeota archaeon]|nr:hypothetical protein [Candidatus Woesearchaeota archaeon]
MYSGLQNEADSSDIDKLKDHLGKVAPAVNYTSQMVGKGIMHTIASVNVTGILADISPEFDYIGASAEENRWVGNHIDEIVSSAGKSNILEKATAPQHHLVQSVTDLPKLHDLVQAGAAYFGEEVSPVVENGVVKGYSTNCGSREIGITSCSSEAVHSKETPFDVACGYKDKQRARPIITTSKPKDAPCGDCSHYTLCSASYELAGEEHPFLPESARKQGVEIAGLLESCIGFQGDLGNVPAVAAHLGVIRALAESGREVYQSLTLAGRTSLHGRHLMQIAGDPTKPMTPGNLDTVANAFEVVLTRQLQPATYAQKPANV